MTTTSTIKCTCRGADPADPCGHGDTSEGCPVHDVNFCDDVDEMSDAEITAECLRIERVGYGLSGDRYQALLAMQDHRDL